MANLIGQSIRNGNLAFSVGIYQGGEIRKVKLNVFRLRPQRINKCELHSTVFAFFVWESFWEAEVPEFAGEFGNKLQQPLYRHLALSWFIATDRRRICHSYVGCRRRRAVSWEIAANLFVNYTFPHTLTFLNARSIPFKKRNNACRRAERSKESQSAATTTATKTIVCSFREELFHHSLTRAYYRAGSWSLFRDLVNILMQVSNFYSRSLKSLFYSAKF